MKSSAVNKILSIIIALLLWTYVIVEVNPVEQKTFRDIPVQLLNETALSGAGLAIAGTTEYTVEVTVSGKRMDVTGLSKDDIVATASLFGYGKGKNQIQVEVTAPEGFTQEWKPSKIQVVIEDLVAASKPIEVNVTNLESGMEEGDLELQPQEIEVSGAKSMVNSVKAVQVTLDAAKLTSRTKSIQLPATAIDADGMPVENVRLSANYVGVSAKLYPVKEVALNVEVTGEPGEGMELASQQIPNKVKIKGPKGVLKDIDSIDAEPVDISGITNNKQIRLTPILPESVELSRENGPLRAEFSLRNLSEREFTYTSNEIRVEGLSSLYVLNIQTPTIKVVATGSKEIMDTITKGAITPIIQAGEVDSATVSLPVTVSYSVSMNSVVVEPEAVDVVVNDVEDAQNADAQERE